MPIDAGAQVTADMVGDKSFCGGGGHWRPNERSARVDLELVHAARLDATVVTG
jgi:hypothetical protein